MRGIRRASPAQPVEVAPAGGVQDRPGTEEQHGLEGRMADDEEHDGHERDLGDGALAGAAQHHRDGQPGDHEADVLLVVEKASSRLRSEVTEASRMP